MRRIWCGIIIAFVIQLTVLILMNLAGAHSLLGGVWAVFYLPATWVIDTTGVPNMSPFANILVIALFQEVILLIVILSLMKLWMRVKPIRTKAS